MPNQVIQVLIIDDDPDNFDGLKNYAAVHHNILLRLKKSYEEGILELQQNKSIDAVILDGKGFMKKNQERGSEKENFVHNSIEAIKEIQKIENRIIPFCVLTAWYDVLIDSLEGRVEKVYDKKKIALDEKLKNEMFLYLKERMLNSDLTRLKDQHPILFEFSSIYFDNLNQSVLIELLKNDKYCSSDAVNIISNLQSLRRLNEHLMEIVWQFYLNKDIRSLEGDGRKTITALNKIEEKIKIPPQLKNSVQNVYYTASSFADHNPSEAQKNLFFPTKYIVIGLTMGFIECVIIAKKLIDSI